MRGRKTWPVAGKKEGGDACCRREEGQRELGPGGNAGCRREEGEAGLGPGCDAVCRREEGEAGAVDGLPAGRRWGRSWGWAAGEEGGGWDKVTCGCGSGGCGSDGYFD